MRDRNYIFLIMLFIAIGCGSSRNGDEITNERWLASEHPTSPAQDNYERSTGSNTQTTLEEDIDDPAPTPPVEEEPEEPTQEPEEPAPQEPEEEPAPQEPEEEPAPQEEPEQPACQSPEEPEDEEISLCFSYLDCPNHEACNIVSSTCFSCTAGWHCNNYFDQQRTGPSACCTQEAFDNERCDLIGTCKE